MSFIHSFIPESWRNYEKWYIITCTKTLERYKIGPIPKKLTKYIEKALQEAQDDGTISSIPISSTEKEIKE